MEMHRSQIRQITELIQQAISLLDVLSPLYEAYDKLTVELRHTVKKSSALPLEERLNIYRQGMERYVTLVEKLKKTYDEIMPDFTSLMAKVNSELVGVSVVIRPLAVNELDALYKPVAQVTEQLSNASQRIQWFRGEISQMSNLEIPGMQQRLTEVEEEFSEISQIFRSQLIQLQDIRGGILGSIWERRLTVKNNG